MDLDNLKEITQSVLALLVVLGFFCGLGLLHLGDTQLALLASLVTMVLGFYYGRSANGNGHSKPAEPVSSPADLRVHLVGESGGNNSAEPTA